MATPQTNVRLSPGIKSQAVAAAAAEEISLSQFVERALVAWLSGECTGPDTARDTGAGTALALIPELVSRVEAIERRLATPPRQDAQQAAPRSVQVSGHPPESPGVSIGAALIAAGAEIAEAHAMGSNRDQRMMTRYGVKGAEWLESQGWRKEGRKWYAPGE